MLQPLINFIYSLIQSSWLISTVLIKYILAGKIVYAYQIEGELKENFESVLQDYSRETVGFMVVLGLLSIISGIKISPLVELPSYLITVLYFGYLFWKF